MHHDLSIGAPPDSFILEQAVSSLGSSLESLLERVEDLEYQDHTTVVIPAVLSTIRRALEVALQELETGDVHEAAETYNQSINRAAARRLLAIQTKTNALRGLNDLVLRLARTTYERKPPWVGELLASIIHDHNPRASFELIFEARPLAVEYEYEDARKDSLEKHLKGLSGKLELDPELLVGLPDTILILGYPAAGPNNVLLHPMFFHEVGHYVTKDIVERLVRAKSQKAEFSLDSGLDHDTRVRILKQCREIDRRWTWEVASDLFAVRLVGPAYVFGLAHVISLSCDVLDVQPEHPPALIRLKAMIETLAGTRGRSGTDHLSHLTGNLKKWMSEVSALVAERSGEINATVVAESEATGIDYATLYQRLESRMPAIRRAVLRLTKGRVYKADKRSLKIKRALVEQLLADIPANEHRVGDATHAVGEATPVDVGDILNAGYEVLYNCNERLLERFSAVHEETDPRTILAGAVRRVRRLLVKSFELKHIQDEYARIRAKIPAEP